MKKQTPEWVKKWKATPKGELKPVAENMQKKMNGTAPEVKENVTRPV